MSHWFRNSNLFLHGSALTIGTVVQVVSGFGVQIVLMRMLMPDDFGRFAMLLAGCGLVQAILSLRLNVLIIRLPEGDEETAGLYQAALVWETAACVIIATLWVLSAGLMSWSVLILLTALTLGQWVNQAVAFYERKMDYARISVIETGSQLTGHMVALIGIVAGAGALSLYLRELAVVICKLVAFSAIGALPHPIWRRPSRAALVTLWTHARGIWSEGILEGAFARLVILASSGLTGLHGTGLFAQSQRLAMLPHQFLSPIISRMSTNMFSRSNNPADRNRLAISMAISATVLITPAITVTWFWAPDLVPWLFGENWREAGVLLKAMVGVILFLSLFDLLRAFCYAVKWVKPVLWGRVAQITIFITPALLWESVEVTELAWFLSAAYAGGFAASLGLTLLTARRSSAAP